MGLRRQSHSACLLTCAVIALMCFHSPVLHGAQSTVIDLAGNAVNPLQASKGRIVVLIFMRTDCPISNRYAPVLKRLSEDYAEKAAFWLVYPSRRTSPEAIHQQVREFGYDLPVVRDPRLTLVKMSRAQITPEAAVFDSAGRLVYHGRIDNLYEDFGHSRKTATTHELQDAIDAAISGKAPATASRPAVGCYISDLE